MDENGFIVTNTVVINFRDEPTVYSEKKKLAQKVYDATKRERRECYKILKKAKKTSIKWYDLETKKSPSSASEQVHKLDQ